MNPTHYQDKLKEPFKKILTLAKIYFKSHNSNIHVKLFHMKNRIVIETISIYNLRSSIAFKKLA
jgi:hypothetical protein